MKRNLIKTAFIGAVLLSFSVSYPYSSLDSTRAFALEWARGCTHRVKEFAHAAKKSSEQHLSQTKILVQNAARNSVNMVSRHKTIVLSTLGIGTAATLAVLAYTGVLENMLSQFQNWEILPRWEILRRKVVRDGSERTSVYMSK